MSVNTMDFNIKAENIGQVTSYDARSFSKGVVKVVSDDGWESNVSNGRHTTLVLFEPASHSHPWPRVLCLAYFF